MLSTKALKKMAYDQRERMFEAARSGTDSTEFFSEPGEAHVAAAILAYVANEHTKSD